MRVPDCTVYQCLVLTGIVFAFAFFSPLEIATRVTMSQVRTALVTE